MPQPTSKGTHRWRLLLLNLIADFGLASIVLSDVESIV